MIIVEPKERKNYYRDLVDELAAKGNHSAMMEVSERFFRSRNYENVEQVIDYLKILAERKIGRAMLLLGNIYYTGKGVEQSYKEAIKWYEMAAEQHESYGWCNLGYCYYYGRDLEVNYEKAYECYSQAAYMGNANAMYKLGDMYFRGNHVEEDKNAAFYWYCEALNSLLDDDIEANIHFRLGLCYLKGYGTYKDILLALEHLQSAELEFFRLIDEGDEFAELTLPKVKTELEDVRRILYESVC
jgi:TPR repeat protein